MTNKQLHLLKTLSHERNPNEEYVHWTIENIDEDDLEELQDLGFVFVDCGEGFMGEVKTLSLTAAGQDFIKSFCATCECMPCDCDWGYN